MQHDTTFDHFLHFIDGISIMTAIGSFFGMLPDVAALFTIIWTGIRIYESKTFQNWLNKE